jgi:teichuronic acid biosynthesis glycosyltransferase TuaC
MINVTHITWGYPSDIVRHEATYFSIQAEALSRSGVARVEVISPLTYVPRSVSWLVGRWSRRLRIPRSYRLNGVYVRRPRYLRLPTPASWQADLALLEITIRKSLKSQLPDVIHVHGGDSFGLAGLRAAKALRIPSILTLHGSDVYVTPNKGLRHRAVFKECMRLAEVCLAVSEDLATTAHRISGVNVQHLPIGVNLQVLRPSQDVEMAKSRFSIPKNRRVVLFLGNLLATKGVEVLLKAMDLLSSSELAVFGGEGPLAEVIRNHPRSLWIGPVPYADVPMVLSIADVFVLPSFSEGLGLVLVEAGAMRVPVVGSDVGGITSLLRERRGCLVPPRDSVALAQGIRFVLENSQWARECSDRFADYIHKHHDSDKNVSELNKIYQGVV